MAGYEITEDQWEKIKDFLPGRPGSVGVTARANRQFVNAVLWMMHSRAYWKDLPPRVWQVENRPQTLYPLGRAGVWVKVLQALPQDPDTSHLMIDSTIVREHQQAICGKGGPR